MAQDPREAVKQYVSNPDEAALNGLYEAYKLLLSQLDASLVSYTDPAELERVRESFLKEKLGLTQSEDELDKAIAAVGEKMAGDTHKSRLAVYYLLAEHFNKLSQFK